MKTKSSNSKLNEPKAGDEEEINLPGYPVYPENEDIYSIFVEESDINPEDISTTKDTGEKHLGSSNKENVFYNEDPVSELDIPGSELDDNMEFIGSEDEENNYYSLGGDDHEDLEEAQGE